MAFGFGGGILLHTYAKQHLSSQRTTSQYIQIMVFLLYALAGRFSGKPQLAQPAWQNRIQGKNSKFFNGSSQNKAEIFFAFFRPRRDLVFSSSHFWGRELLHCGFK